MLSSVQSLMRTGSSIRETKNCMKVCVQTLESSYTFSIHPSTTGKELLTQVAKKIELKETWYFGLRYKDNRGHEKWIFPDKKVLQQDMAEMTPPTFKLCVKFYPEDTSEIIQDITLRLFYLHVKHQVISDELVCSPEMATLLASYAAQSKFGDYNETEHPPGTLLNERLIPTSLFRQYHLSEKEWETRIVDLWKNHQGESTEQAMIEYLKQAQKLEMFGLNYFEIKNKKGSELFLGVYALGMNVYECDDKLVSRITFQWSEINKISFADKRFVIKFLDKKSANFVFYVPHKRITNEILMLCMGNHELYVRRRRPETAEVKQLKQQVQNKRNLQVEQFALEKLQKVEKVKRQEYEKELCQLRESMRLKDGDILHAHDQIRHLEQKLAESEKVKQELVDKEKELEDSKRRLQTEKELSAEERSRLAGKIEVLEAQVAVSRLRIEAPKDKPSLLQETVADRRKRFQMNENATKFLANKMSHQRQTETKKQPDPDKPTIEEKLELMSKGFDELKKPTAMTEKDVLRKNNQRKGYNRRSMFNVIEDGNTHRRVEQFENM